MLVGPDPYPSLLSNADVANLPRDETEGEGVDIVSE